MDIALIMDNQMENEMDTEIMQGLIEMLRGLV